MQRIKAIAGKSNTWMRMVFVLIQGVKSIAKESMQRLSQRGRGAKRQAGWYFISTEIA